MLRLWQKNYARIYSNTNWRRRLPVIYVCVKSRVCKRMGEIVGLLRARSSIHLSELLKNEHSRLVIIVTFLAVLELWKRERISVTQTSLFNPILLERGERWSENEQLSEEELEYGA